MMKVVIDIGESAADQRRVLELMAKGNLSLVTDHAGGARVGCLLDGVLELPELRWAPYQEFGVPDPAAETHSAPAGPVMIGSVGYRRGPGAGDEIVVYWYRPRGDVESVPIPVRRRDPAETRALLLGSGMPRDLAAALADEADKPDG
jgi:hypothetical protein